MVTCRSAWFPAAVAAALLSLAIPAQAPAAAGDSIEGVAMYRERLALPPDAVFEAALEDVSRADAPAVRMGCVVVEQPKTPIRFVIPFDPAVIFPERIYAVRARILVDGQLWFTTDRIHRVLTGGGGRSVEIVLRSVRGGGDRPPEGLRLPVTFRGDLPCADCEGVRHHLDLWTDNVFHLRREWLGKGLVRGDVGRWRVDPPGRALVLEGGAEGPLRFEILGPDRLRLLDRAGGRIVSDLPYDLRADGGLAPADLPSMPLRGEMTYMADAARFTECLTGRVYAIEPGPEALRLQRAYLADVRSPGGALHVTFEGTLTRRPGMEEGRIAPTVVVDRFVGTWPGQTCGRGRADAELENTYWRIVRMKGEAVRAVPGVREPRLILRRADGRSAYSATVGCNQLAGSFARDGGRITFRTGASTLMACPGPLAALERVLIETLGAARGWEILGGVLVLKDASGNELALLEAVHL